MHVKYGVDIVKKSAAFGDDVIDMVRCHHERFDGSGYPDGLRGEEIPLASRIISLADAFDAMTCNRPYQPARGEHDAVTELRKESGRQFDPNLVYAFVSIVETGAVLVETPACAETMGDRQ
jgi:HD-GYP domain-containing protein (c-di-GMP phosphodiesterase class II)